MQSLGLTDADAFGPDTVTVPGGARMLTLDEAKARLALGRPDFVTAIRTQSVDQALVTRTQQDDQTLADYLAVHADPGVEALANASPTFDARTRLRADGNVDFDALKVDGTTSTVVTMGDENRRHVLASVIRDGHARPNREAVYRAIYGSLPSAAAMGLPAPASIGALADGALDLALDELGRYAASAAASLQQPAFPLSVNEHCSAEVSGLSNGQQDVFVHDPDGLYARMTWSNKGRMTCVRDQGNRGTCPAFSTTSALEMYTAMKTGTRYDLSEQDLYANYKRLVGEWKTDGAWPDELTMLEGVQGYAAPLEADWVYNPSWQLAPTPDAPFHGACNGYTGPCSETAHQTPMDCFRLQGWTFCSWAPPKVTGVATMPLEPTQPSLRVETSLLSRTTAINLTIWLLASGDRQVVVSFVVDDAFDQAGANGYVAAPFGGNRGAHATHAVGWVANSNLLSGVAPGAGGGYFILKNSWGRGRGDQGYYYAPVAWLSANVLDVVAL